MGIFESVITGYTQTFYPMKKGKITPLFPDISGIGMIGSGAIATGWNALSTTGKVAVGAAGGAGGYAAYDWLFGKKAAPINQNPVQTQNASQPVIVQPVVVQPNNPVTNQYDFSQLYNTISGSPNSYIDSKKSMSQNAPFSPFQNVPFEVVPQQTTTATQPTTAATGTDFVTLAVIAGIALLAYGYTSRGKGK